MHTKKQIGVILVGGRGYGIGELLRLLAVHPEAEVASVVSSSGSDEIGDAHPHLRSVISGNFATAVDLSLLSAYQQKFIVFALPNEITPREITRVAAACLAQNIRIIDLSGAYRLTADNARRIFYPESLESNLPCTPVYGMPEINFKAIREAQFVANPGCLASGAALALLPLVRNGVCGAVVVDAKTGSSGAGRSPADRVHHPLRHSSVTAYQVLKHRHEPEIAQTIGDPEGARIELTFVPHLVPASRGIFISAYAASQESLTQAVWHERFLQFYREAPFIRIVKDPPELAAVAGSNYCDIAVAVRNSRVVVLAALDNLVKGMAGQAIQNLNIMAGLDQCCGLKMGGLGPY